MGCGARNGEVDEDGPSQAMAFAAGGIRVRRCDMRRAPSSAADCAYRSPQQHSTHTPNSPLPLTARPARAPGRQARQPQQGGLGTQGSTRPGGQPQHEPQAIGHRVCTPLTSVGYRGPRQLPMWNDIERDTRARAAREFLFISRGRSAAPWLGPREYTWTDAPVTCRRLADRLSLSSPSHTPALTLSARLKWYSTSYVRSADRLAKPCARSALSQSCCSLYFITSYGLTAPSWPAAVRRRISCCSCCLFCCQRRRRGAGRYTRPRCGVASKPSKYSFSFGCV